MVLLPAPYWRIAPVLELKIYWTVSGPTSHLGQESLYMSSCCWLMWDNQPLQYSLGASLDEYSVKPAKTGQWYQRGRMLRMTVLLVNKEPLKCSCSIHLLQWGDICSTMLDQVNNTILQVYQLCFRIKIDWWPTPIIFHSFCEQLPFLFVKF